MSDLGALHNALDAEKWINKQLVNENDTLRRRISELEAEVEQLRADLTFLQQEYGESNESMTEDAKGLKERCRVLKERDELRAQVAVMTETINAAINEGLRERLSEIGYSYGDGSLADLVSRRILHAFDTTDAGQEMLEYIGDIEWLKEAAEELLDEYLTGELEKPCRVLLRESAVCRDECYTDCAARRLQTVLKKLKKNKVIAELKKGV